MIINNNQRIVLIATIATLTFLECSYLNYTRASLGNPPWIIIDTILEYIPQLPSFVFPIGAAFGHATIVAIATRQWKQTPVSVSRAVCRYSVLDMGLTIIRASITFGILVQTR